MSLNLVIEALTPDHGKDIIKFFQKLGYKIYTESNYYKENDEICMIRW